MGPTHTGRTGRAEEGEEGEEFAVHFAFRQMYKYWAKGGAHQGLGQSGAQAHAPKPFVLPNGGWGRHWPTSNCCRLRPTSVECPSTTAS